MRFTEATHYEEVQGNVVNLDGAFISHKADVIKRKTACGLEIGLYHDGWLWGSPTPKPTCFVCRLENVV